MMIKVIMIMMTVMMMTMMMMSAGCSKPSASLKRGYVHLDTRFIRSGTDTSWRSLQLVKQALIFFICSNFSHVN